MSDDQRKYAEVPSDFPRPQHLGAVPGSQPKLLMVKYDGRYYPSGCTPPELYDRWEACEDLIRQFVTASLETKAGKRAHMSEVDILDQYLNRLIDAKWTSEPEARWIFSQVASKLNWPPPSAAAPK